MDVQDNLFFSCVPEILGHFHYTTTVRIIDSIPNVFGGKPTSQMYLGGAAFDSTTIDPIRGNS